MRPTTSLSAIAARPWFWPAVLAALAASLLLPGLGAHGFWEPHEIVIADRAQALAAEEVAEDDDAPALSERAIAKSIDMLGVSERAARAPMALFGLLALSATVALGWRLAGRRAALFAGVVLLSFPLFAMPSRLLVGDVATAAAHALIALGAAGFCFPRASQGPSRWLVSAADLLFVTAGVALGQAAAGTLLGVTAPLAAIALAAWLAVASGRPEPGARSRAHWGGVILVSAAAAAAALWTIVDAYELIRAYPGDRAIFGLTLQPASGDVGALGGAWRDEPDLDATFDVLFEHVAFGLFPWSVLAPIALVMPALVRGSGPRAFAGRLCLGWATASWAAAVFLYRAVGPVPFPALAAVAVAIGLFLDDLLRVRAGEERPGMTGALPLVAVFTTLAAAVLAKDMIAFPETIVGAHLVGDNIEVPDALRGWVIALGGAGALVALTLALGLHGWVPEPRSRLAFARAPLRRAVHAAVVLSILYAGFLAHGWIPALSGQFSSKGLFDALSQERAPGERLVILGSPGPGHGLYARGELETVSSRSELVELFSAPERSFALIRRSRLCPVQQAAAKEDVAYHVIYDGNADFLLLSNQLGEGQPDLNPLSRMILRERPASIAQPFDATFNERIRLIGYDMPQRVSRGATFEMTLYYEVLKPISRNWKVFVHFDTSRRFNGDHEPAEGVCGTRYWQRGDIIVDRFEVTAGGTGHPRGEHEVWTGFFVGSRGSWTNMVVSDAPEADEQDRVKLGTIVVE